MTALAAATNATQSQQEFRKLGPGAHAVRSRRCLPCLHEPMGSLMGFFVVAESPAVHQHS